jgi:predicted PurR-regulated permease PerM
MPRLATEHRNFLVLLAVVSVAFAVILWPLFGALFWAMVLTVLFWPLQQRLLRRWPERHNLCALITLLACTLLVLVPAAVVGGLLADQGATLVARLSSGELDFGRYLQEIVGLLPSWAFSWLQSVGLADLASIQERLSSVAVQASQFVATRVLTIGQNALQFAVNLGVMLYVLFFLLRDGRSLQRMVSNAIPLNAQRKAILFGKFITVIRATVKGNVLVAATQGLLGGLIFWILGVQGALLWAVLMGLLSLLPAVGAGLIWLPVALYFVAIGDLTSGLILIAYGVLVIGMVDNVLRPILVGKDTKMPDYLVLVSTLGGMAMFGLNGFVIGPLIAALFMATWALHGQPPAATDAAPNEAPVLPPTETKPEQTP